MAKTRNYSDFLSSVCALIGVPTSRLSTELAESLNLMFNNSIRDIWMATQWFDTCPRGEARFVGNRLTYPNNLSKTAYWTNTALTITANNIANPLDGEVTASRLMETAANSVSGPSSRRWAVRQAASSGEGLTAGAAGSVAIGKVASSIATPSNVRSCRTGAGGAGAAGDGKQKHA
jgi:hypothetical protein